MASGSQEFECRPVVCCWGTHSNRGLREAIQARGDHINERGIQPMCLKINDDGTPGHPLYLSSTLELRAYV